MYQYISILLIVLNLHIAESSYDSKQANVGVFLSGAAYCGKDKYSSMVLTGPAKGFVVTGTLYDRPTDLEGFVGYLDSTKSIHVVLRGSSSVLNWLDDFEVRQIEYTTWTECGCEVHKGFYKAALGLTNETLHQVKILMKLKPTYKVYVEGHSLGAAIADLLSMELLKNKITSIVYGYGKPRVGDEKYAQFYNSMVLEHYRHTHNKDMVPHLPPMTGLGYYHSCQEIFEDELNALKFCSKTNCEDDTCGNQFTITQTNTDDHLYYLGHRVSCENSTIQ